MRAGSGANKPRPFSSARSCPPPPPLPKRAWSLSASASPPRKESRKHPLSVTKWRQLLVWGSFPANLKISGPGRDGTFSKMQKVILIQCDAGSECPLAWAAPARAPASTGRLTLHWALAPEGS